MGHLNRPFIQLSCCGRTDVRGQAGGEDGMERHGEGYVDGTNYYILCLRYLVFTVTVKNQSSIVVYFKPKGQLRECSLWL